MSAFYGSVQGQRGEATRCGHSGIRASAQSWEGSIVTRLWQAEDVVYCSIIACEGSSKNGIGVTLYSGRLSYLVNEEGHHGLIRALAHLQLEKAYATGA